jgi:hypothetical protein
MRLTAPTVRPEVSILDEAESVSNTTGSDNHVMVASGLGAGKDHKTRVGETGLDDC